MFKDASALAFKKKNDATTLKNPMFPSHIKKHLHENIPRVNCVFLLRIIVSSYLIQLYSQMYYDCAK